MQLIHGDCISAMDQMPDGSVDLILTDQIGRAHV